MSDNGIANKPTPGAPAVAPPAQKEKKSIRQRADELQRKLGGTGRNVGMRPGPQAQPIHPGDLVTPPEYAALWAQSEAFLVDSFAEAIPKWIKSFMLQPCKVTMAIVQGSPGCVTASAPLSTLLLSRTHMAPGGGGPPARKEAREFCLKAVDALARHFENWRAGLAPLGLSWYPPYAAILPAYVPGMPNSHSFLSDLGRTNAHLLNEPSIQSKLANAADPHWLGLYDNLLQPGARSVGNQVFESVARQLAKYMDGVVNQSVIAGVLARSLTPPQPPHAAPLPFTGMTDVAPGFVTVIETWRPEWDRAL